ncbi:PREDICTED: uncharacterized protein LOC109239680 [Nicotiana attenuata]|uniref:Uncharacterized protein n=1 Tax=Nicotiana attenuata TaxID=49451 RepID=A0A314LBV1_NICAT|nr:PREDICTED: uncharacterized protein LOC109239680 [Nicotiana attenuata]OIT38244.1 hypothetical protein A4A49_32038 [Nicotiana attenuata]
MMHRTIMAIEEHTHRYSNISGGGGGGGSSGSGGGVSSRASKKLKQKKVPQRGLGVAQLERMLEEQHKKDLILTPNSVHSTNTMSKNLAVECPTFRPTINPSSIPLPPPSKMDLRPSKSFVFRPNQSGPVIDGFRPKTLQSSKPLNRSGCELNWSSVLSSGKDNSPKLWSCEYSPERENQQGNHNGVVFGPNVNLPNELHNPILPLPSVLQRSQQYQQPSCSSSMVNISSGISSSSSSVLNYQMEPPSNQNYYSCNYLPLWPEEVKMVGMKRPYPFSPEYPPVPAFHCKFPPGYVSLASRSPESASCSNECTASLESGNRLKREVPSGSRSISESKPRNVFRQNRALNGDFLTLAPPSTASPYQSQETLTLESTNCQGVAEEPTTCSVQQPIFGFFPSAKVQLGQEGTNKSNCHAEVGETVDLNLKL